MASWIAHLRAAERLLELIPLLDEALFAIGNIAPDSGIPDATWEHFNPPVEITHFKQDKSKLYRTGDLLFYRKYLLSLRGRDADPLKFSFLFGYFFHLL